MQCPVLYLDTVQFEPNWQERDRTTARSMVAAFLEANSAWVIDGNYAGFHLETRLQQADQILLLLFPRHICFFRILKRFLQFRNQTRESMAPGCEEKIDLPFLKWVLWEGRSQKKQRWYAQILVTYPQKVKVLKNRRQVSAYLQSLSAAAHAPTKG